MRKFRCIVALLLLPCLPAFALEPPQWLAGHWRTEAQGVITEEVWLAPAQGLMTGISRTHGGKKPFFEFLVIEQQGETLRYIARPRGGATTVFGAVSADTNQVVFENTTHDFPQRIIYERRGSDGLAARIEGNDDGKPRTERWDYQRVR